MGQLFKKDDKVLNIEKLKNYKYKKPKLPRIFSLNLVRLDGSNCFLKDYAYKVLLIVNTGRLSFHVT